jgi:hypothetical protein
MKIRQNFTLKDDDGKEFVVTVNQDSRGSGIEISPAGYGDALSQDGKGTPIYLELWEGKLQLVVWDDINKEDPSHIINLEGAKESERKKR